jgi:hypothetical protein
MNLSPCWLDKKRPCEYDNFFINNRLLNAANGANEHGETR